MVLFPINLIILCSKSLAFKRRDLRKSLTSYDHYKFSIDAPRPYVELTSTFLLSQNSKKILQLIMSARCLANYRIG